MSAYISFYAGIVADLVKVVGCYSRSDFTTDDIQHLTREAADFSHGILTGFVEDCEFIPTK